MAQQNAGTVDITRKTPVAPPVNGAPQTPNGGFSLAQMQADMLKMQEMLQQTMTQNETQAAIIRQQSQAAQAAPQVVYVQQPVAQQVKAAPIQYVAPEVLPEARPVVEIANGKLGLAPGTTGNRRKSKNACGAKSPNGLCHKCAGPFDPIKHYSLHPDLLLPLDSTKTAPTGEDWDVRAFMGLSCDAQYAGNVVLVGFGKDCLNMKPKTFIRLATALNAAKAVDFIKAKLDDSYWKE